MGRDEAYGDEATNMGITALCGVCVQAILTHLVKQVHAHVLGVDGEGLDDRKPHSPLRVLGHSNHIREDVLFCSLSSECLDHGGQRRQHLASDLNRFVTEKDTNQRQNLRDRRIWKRKGCVSVSYGSKL